MKKLPTKKDLEAEIAGGNTITLLTMRVKEASHIPIHPHTIQRCVGCAEEVYVAESSPKGAIPICDHCVKKELDKSGDHELKLRITQETLAEVQEVLKEGPKS